MTDTAPTQHPTIYDQLATTIEHLLANRNGAGLSPDQMSQVQGTINSLKAVQLADEETVTALTARVAALESGLSSLEEELTAADTASSTAVTTENSPSS